MSLDLSPDLLDSGAIARQLASIDDLDPTDPAALALLVGYLVEQLDEPLRSCVQMTVLNGLTYEEAALLLEPELGRKVPRMQTWRWTQYGLRQMREWLEGTPWVRVLMAERLPLDATGVDGPEDVDNAGVIDLEDRR